jgi:stage III sporulation protein AA
MWNNSWMNEAEEAKQEEIRRQEKQYIVQLLPTRFQQSVRRLGSMIDHAIEIVFDLGRKPSIRMMLEMDDITSTRSKPSSAKLPTSQMPLKRAVTKAITTELQGEVVSMEDIVYIANQLGEFTTDNRCGLSGTLHRISRKLNRQGDIIAYTIRFGHSVPGTTRMITDLITERKSMLLIGMPGVGKTTLLREIARILSTPSASNSSPVRVEIIDTSNEIAGEGNIAHSAIGAARRMMVRDRKAQHEVMIEAVQNHTPECIIIDEIGTKKEAKAACDIAQRGVQLIGTVHGVELRQLMENSELNGLIGGVHTVVLGDDEARRRKIRTKSVLEQPIDQSISITSSPRYDAQYHIPLLLHPFSLPRNHFP